MVAWAYFSARAMLTIYVSALVHCPERSSGYLLSDYHIPSHSLPKDPDLQSIMFVFWNISHHYPPFNHFADPRNTPAHIIFMADLYLRHVWSQRNHLDANTNGFLKHLTIDSEDWHAFPTAAVADLLVVGSLFLGGAIEDETLGNTNKSSVFLASLLFRMLTTLLISDRLETISSHFF